METGITREDWLLLFLSPETLGVEDASPLDPIRIQKGLFLLSVRGPQRNIYDFEPYNWGPYSPNIYADLRTLTARHLIRSESVPGHTWGRYSATETGRERASLVANALGGASVAWLAQAREFVTSRSFKRLLEDVYEMYPEYTTKSLFREQNAAEA